MERYKDNLPTITIKKIKSILSEFGIVLEEEWHEPIDGIFYVTVYCKDTDLTSNGKGSDKMYALSHKVYDDNSKMLFKCGAGKVIMTVLENSNIVPCSIYNHNCFKLGKITDDSIFKYFEGSFDYVNYNKCILKNKKYFEFDICDGLKI